MPIREKYQRNRNHYLEWQREYRKERRTFSRKLCVLYSQEELEEAYDRAYEEQNGKCAICEKPGNGPRRLHLDHSHKTDQLRGLLCWSCNTKLGWVEKWLSKIVKYLRRWS